MSENKLNVAEIGKTFTSSAALDFFSKQNLLEFDLIIINAAALANQLRFTSLQEIDERLKDFHVFSTIKQIPVIYFARENDLTFAVNNGQNRVAKNVGQIFGIPLEARSMQGKVVEVIPKTYLTDFLSKYKDNFFYEISYLKYPGINLLLATGQNASVSFVCETFLFLPPVYEFDFSVDEDIFLADLYDALKPTKEKLSDEPIPSWASSFMLPNEAKEILNESKLKTELERINLEIDEQHRRIEVLQSFKALTYAGGTSLEQIIKSVFEELGFTILEAEQNRDDLIMQRNDMIVIAEIKGLTKSAAEKNAVQLEKWITNYILKNEVKPKGLLIVNTYKELPVSERPKESFPHQMLEYSVKRDQCLLTSVQLLGLLLTVRQSTTQKDHLIDELLSTVGVYEKFTAWSDVLNFSAE